MINHIKYLFIRNYHLLFNKEGCFQLDVGTELMEGGRICFPYNSTAIYLGNNWFIHK